MKRQLAIACVCVAALQNVSAANWEPSTHEFTIEFPAADWTIKEGGEIGRGRMLLAAENRQQNKSVNVLRFQVAQSFSVKDPEFVTGMKEGFAQNGSRLLSDGYTNINDRVAYPDCKGVIHI